MEERRLPKVEEWRKGASPRWRSRRKTLPQKEKMRRGKMPPQKGGDDETRKDASPKGGAERIKKDTF